MLFSADAWPGVRDGSITLTFRAWKRPQARTGGRSRTPVGVLAIDDIRRVPVEEITREEARMAGYTSLSGLRARLEPAREVYRIAFHLAGPDPRIALRNSARMDDTDMAEVDRRLMRFDRASRRGPWTRTTLELIAAHPATRAADLAPMLKRDTASFKADVRKLKELGLTESLATGYRLSKRGQAYLHAAPVKGHP